MKKVLILSIVILSLFSCNRSPESVPEDQLKENPISLEEISVAELLMEKSKAENFEVQTNVIETFKPTMVDKADVSDSRTDPGRGDCLDCCCTCNGNLTLHLPTNPEGCAYQVELYVGCSSDFPTLFLTGNLTFLGAWSNNPNSGYYTTDTSFDFEVIDEHFYFVVATIGDPINGLPCTLDATVSDGINGQYNLTLEDLLTTGLANVPALMLHCDDISYSECWNGPINPVGGLRECCL